MPFFYPQLHMLDSVWLSGCHSHQLAVRVPHLQQGGCKQPRGKRHKSCALRIACPQHSSNQAPGPAVEHLKLPRPHTLSGFMILCRRPTSKQSCTAQRSMPRPGQCTATRTKGHAVACARPQGALAAACTCTKAPPPLRLTATRPIQSHNRHKLCCILSSRPFCGWQNCRLL